MRLQTLFLLAVLAIIVNDQCYASDEPEHKRKSHKKKDDDDDKHKDDTANWDSSEVYLDDNDDDYIYGRDYNRGRDRDDSRGDSREYRRSRKGSKNRKYDDDDDDDKYDRDDDSYERRPSKHTKKPKEVGHMNVYIREPSKDGKRHKPKRFRFPTANYERERFPRSFSPLVSFMPWVPIFADRLTKQTIIFSPTGGVYILPPVISFYGKLISVAQLIASGYASLVSTGAPPPPAVDVRPLVQPGPVVGPGVPKINPATGGFTGGVRTEFRSFARPDYPKAYEDRSYSRQGGDEQPRVGY